MAMAADSSWRPKSVVNTKHEQIQLAWVRDPFDPQITRVATTVTIRRVKQRQSCIQGVKDRSMPCSRLVTAAESSKNTQG